MPSMPSLSETSPRAGAGPDADVETIALATGPGSDPEPGRSPRSRTRKAGESAFGALLLLRNVLLCLVTAFLLAAGLWQSWDSAWPAVVGHQRGTVQVTRCHPAGCSGTFTPKGATGRASDLPRVTLSATVSGKVGERLAVAVRPGTTQAVRTGPAGWLYGAVPFGGALLLASVVVAGGMRWRRTALVLGLLGAAVVGGAWAALSF